MFARKIFAILLIAFLLVIGLCLVFFLNAQPWSFDQNIVIIPQTIDGPKEKIFLAHISPSSNKIEVSEFPQDFAVPVIGGYGKYPLRSIYPLLQIDTRGQQFLLSAYSFGLGVAVDQVWTSKQAALFTQSLSFSQLTQKILAGQITTPLHLSQKIWFARFVLGLRPDQITVHTVDDPNQWLQQQTHFQFPSQSKECSLSVVNTTSSPGLGTKVATVLEQSGYSVLRVTNSPDAQRDATLIMSADQQQTCKEVVAHIQDIFPIEVRTQTDPSALTQYRSQIVIFLGKDVISSLQN